MKKRVRLSSSQRKKETAYHEAGHCVMQLYYGVMPTTVRISEAEGQTLGGDCSTLEDYELDLICLAGTAAEHIFKGDFAVTLAQMLSGAIPAGADSDFAQLRNRDRAFLAEGMLLLHDLLLSERWIVLSQMADALIEKGDLDAEDLDQIACRLSAAYRSMERLAKLKTMSIGC